MSRPRHPLLFAFLAAVLVFMLAPLVIVVVFSFSSGANTLWPPPGFSTRWYGNLVEQPDFGPALARSLGLAALATIGALIAGLLASVAIVRHRFRGRGAAQALFLAPMIVPKIALGLAGFMFLLRISLYDRLLGLVLLHIVIVLPFVTTVMTAGLLRVDLALEEAARDLGASPLRAFAGVTVPQIRSALAAAAVLSFIISFDEVDATIMAASPDLATLPLVMYTYAQKYSDPTLAALSSLLILATLVAVGVVFVLLGRNQIGYDVVRRGRNTKEPLT